ncbi:hypothetical protein DL93DRAFT_2095976 [Clavulina sp. PMI_390]|nr:hypothetical protein DL93DRAFT_2095976 [Clavulina sp. PMI_390]
MSYTYWSPVEQTAAQSSSTWTAWDGRPLNEPYPPAPRLGCIPLPDVEDPIILDQAPMGLITPPSTPPMQYAALPAPSSTVPIFEQQYLPMQGSMAFTSYSNSAVIGNPNALWQHSQGIAPSNGRPSSNGMWSQRAGEPANAHGRRSSTSSSGHRVHFDEDVGRRQRRRERDHPYQGRQEEQNGFGGGGRGGGNGRRHQMWQSVPPTPDEGLGDEYEVDEDDDDLRSRRPPRNR